jgi:hypothetical protein
MPSSVCELDRFTPTPALPLQGHLERAALAKWGSMAALEAERDKRQERREQRSITTYFQQQQPLGGGQQQQQLQGQGQRQEQQPQDQQQSQAEPAAAGEQQALSSAAAAAAAGPATALPSATAAAARQLPWLHGLPPLIAERVCLVPRPQQPAARASPPVQAVQQQSGQYVLCWMQTALRGHENPALDAAAAASRHLGLPLVVASFLLASHPYASVRRYMFALEGLRDAQAELRQQVCGACMLSRARCWVPASGWFDRACMQLCNWH